MSKIKAETKSKKVDITDILKCELTEEEQKQAAKTLARHLDELEQLEGEKKTITENLKSKITACETNVSLTKCLVRDAFEYRRVNCEKVLDFEKGKVIVTRKDTGETIEDRDMFTEERQQKMDFKE